MPLSLRFRCLVLQSGVNALETPTIVRPKCLPAPMASVNARTMVSLLRKWPWEEMLPGLTRRGRRSRRFT